MAAFGEEFTLSDIDDLMLEFEDKFEARYAALETVTVKTLKEQSAKIEDFDRRLKCVEQTISNSNLSELDDSLSSLREEFDQLKHNSVRFTPEVQIERFTSLNRPGRSAEEAPLAGSRENAPMASSTPSLSPQKKKTKYGRLFVQSRSPSAWVPPNLLEDVNDRKLREDLEKFYDSKVSYAEKLSPVQLAFVSYYFNVIRRGEYSGRSHVISELYARGVENGMWRDGWTPENIKGSFRDYLKEKVRNLNKKKLQEKATGELVDKMMDQ